MICGWSRDERILTSRALPADGGAIGRAPLAASTFHRCVRAALPAMRPVSGSGDEGRTGLGGLYRNGTEGS